MKKSLLFCLLFQLCFLNVAVCGVPTLSNLRCEYRENPLGIDIPAPLLSWEVASSVRGGEQSTYHIIVSDNISDIEKNRGNVWNSGKIRSSNSNNILYSGKKLRPSTRYFWKIRVSTNHGDSQWSSPAFFETALFNTDDWKEAVWIGDGSSAPLVVADFYEDDPAPIFRKEHNISKKIASARLYISGLGYYEASVNGVKVGNNCLDPGWTSYDSTVLYNTYDITDMFSNGTNVIGLLLGNGFYNPLPLRVFQPLREFLSVDRPKVKVRILITYADGKTENILTDESWKVLYSPIVRNNVYIGEHYDARKELTDWNKQGFGSDGKNAVKVSEPKGVLRAQQQPPIRETAVLKPIRMTESRPGVFVFDMGQNFAGVARLKVRGDRGVKVTMRYGEEVYSDGSLNGMTSVPGQNKKVWDADRTQKGQPQTAYQQNSYILSGNSNGEVWQPKFVYHGFRYVEVTGYPGRPTLESIEGVRLSADLEKNGEFSCSNELINRIEKNIQWTFLSNVFSVQSDCPHREKFGYGGDIVCTLDAFSYLYDMSNFHTKTVRDFAEAARPTGAMTETAPYMGIADYGFGEGSGPIGWQLAYSLTQKKLYDFYGNKRIIADNYDIFKKQIDYLESKAIDNIIDSDNCLGDHEALEFNLKPITFDTRFKTLTATAQYYHHLLLISEFAKILDKEGDFKRYSEKAEDVKRAFIEKFYDPQSGVLGNNTQISQSFGLFYDLVPDNDNGKALKQLIANIDRVDGHIITGIFATPMMLDILSNSDNIDIAYDMVTKRDFPGWGYMIEKGATTLWETWAYSDNTFSHNHPMFGSVNEWFYKSLLGIRATSAGFETLLIAPKPATDMKWAKGSYKSIKGVVEVDWRKEENGMFLMNITIPFGVTADVVIPNPQSRRVAEGTIDIKDVTDIMSVRHENGSTIMKVGSGKYSFVVD